MNDHLEPTPSASVWRLHGRILLIIETLVVVGALSVYAIMPKGTGSGMDIGFSDEILLIPLFILLGSYAITSTLMVAIAARDRVSTIVIHCLNVTGWILLLGYNVN